MSAKKCEMIALGLVRFLSKMVAPSILPTLINYMKENPFAFLVRVFAVIVALSSLPIFIINHMKASPFPLVTVNQSYGLNDYNYFGYADDLDQFKEGKSNRLKKEFIESIQYKEIKKRMDDADELTKMGIFYRDQKKDYEKAMNYFKMAQDQGGYTGLMLAFDMHREGLGFPKRNSDSLQILLGYAEKHIRIPNEISAEKHIRIPNEIGYLYGDDQGDSYDLLTSRKYFKMSADNGDSEGQFRLARSLYVGLKNNKSEGKSEPYNKEVMSQIAKLAHRAAWSGYDQAQYFLGVLYQNGEGVFKNNAIAIMMYRLAADKGVPGAQCSLGKMYYSGFTVFEDKKKARELFESSRKNGKYLGIPCDKPTF